jgi:hypothetical protein
MFGKRRLWRDGVEGQAVVTAMDTRRAGASSFRTKLAVTVRFEDGASVDFSARVLDSEVGDDIVVGSIVPVRYDASDRRQVVLDLPALKAAHGAALATEAESQKAAIARSQAKITESNRSTG